MSVEWILEGLLLGIICFIGVIGNVMSIYIFYSKSYGPSGINQINVNYPVIECIS